MDIVGKLTRRREAGAPVTVRVKRSWRPAESIEGHGVIVGVVWDGGVSAVVSGLMSRDDLADCLRACVLAYRGSAEATGMSRADAAQAAADVLADVFSGEGEGAGHDAA